MPSVSWPTINIYYQTFTGTGLNINSTYSSQAYKENTGLAGGVDWWYYTNSVTIPSASPPTGYSHRWQFVSWFKNNGAMKTEIVEAWRKAWGDLGWGYRLPINQTINRNTGVELPAYNGEVFNYYFNIVETTGIEYSYTYVYNNGDANSIIAVRYGDTITLSIGTKSKTGHYFNYFTSSIFGNKTNGSSFVYNTAGFATFSAVWTANTYTIRYNANPGNGIVSGITSDTSATYNNGLTIRSNGFTRTGFYFDGWATTANGGVSQDYIVGSTINHPGSNSTLDLYAVWIALYNITFNNSGRGESISTVLSGKSGTVITAFPILSNMLGYIFSGWMINSVLITSVTLTGNVILYAKWDVDERVSFSYIQEIFGGNNPISLSEYYSNNGYVNRPGGNGVPTSGEIRMFNFLNKYKSTYLPAAWITMFTDITVANMDVTNGIDMGLDNVDDNFASIGTVGFSFFWYGTDYGTTNDIQWNTNNVLTFGGGSTRYQAWTATEKKGVLMGQADRRTNLARQFAPVIQNGFNIKRLVVKQHNYFNTYDNGIEMEILLMRGISVPLQFIVIKMGFWNINNNAGIWNISDGANFKNIFEGTPPVGTGKTVVLIGSGSGQNWASYNLPYTDAITIMGNNLVLYHNGYDIDGHINNTLGTDNSVGTSISIWKDYSNSFFLTKQDYDSTRPKYLANSFGASFSEGKYLVSNINLHNYSQMNIFIVWKKAVVVNNVVKFLFTMAGGATTYKPRRLYYADNTSSGSFFAVGIGGTTNDSYGYFKLPLGRRIIMNFEFNSPGNVGKTYINGEYLGYFTNGQLVVDNANQQFYIGTFINDYNTTGFVHTIYEVIVINRLLTDSERRNIHNLLCSKWEIFDDITKMTINLLLHHDANNVDGDNNKLSSGSTLAVWHNSASPNEKNAQIKSVQSFLSEYPTYTTNGVEFTTVAKRLTSNINLHNYPQLNIFVVFKRTSLDSPTFSYIWRSEVSGDSYGRSIFLRNSPNLLYIGTGDTVVVSITNPFTINTTYIVNCEYNNLEEKNGKFYLNNINLITFTCEAVTQGTITTSFCKSMISIYYEIIVIDRLLTTTERTKIYNHLKNKWNVP